MKKAADYTNKIKVTLRKNGTKLIETINEEPSMTDPSFGEECDVNTIMQKYLKTRVWPGQNLQGHYSDLSEVPDLLTAMEQVQSARDAFDSLPAAARDRFANDPLEMIEFLKDPKNLEEAVELGLVTKREAAPKPTPAPETTQPKPDEKPKN